MLQISLNAKWAGNSNEWWQKRKEGGDRVAWLVLGVLIVCRKSNKAKQAIGKDTACGGGGEINRQQQGMLVRARNELELLAAKKRGIAGGSLPAARQQQRNKMKQVVAVAAASITEGGEGGVSGGSHPEEDHCQPAQRQEETRILGGKEKKEGTSMRNLPPPASSKESEVAGMVLTIDEEESRLPILERRHSAPVVTHNAPAKPRGSEATTSQTERPRPGEQANVSPMSAWSCSLCTLLNEPLDPHCIMCGTLREMKEGGLVVTNDTNTNNRKKGPTKATHEGEQQRHGQHMDEGRDIMMQAELEEMRAKNEKLMALLMKMKDEANRAKEEKERYASYEALMAALTAGIINDDHLETVESELEARLALVRQLRRDRVRARLLALEREEREMRATTLCIICTDSPRAVTFAPCGHFITCIDCGDTPETCPLCRKWISFRLKTYKN